MFKSSRASPPGEMTMCGCCVILCSPRLRLRKGPCIPSRLPAAVTETSVQSERLPSHLRGKSGDREPPDGCILYVQTRLRGTPKSFFAPGDLAASPTRRCPGRPGPHGPAGRPVSPTRAVRCGADLPGQPRPRAQRLPPARRAGHTKRPGPARPPAGRRASGGALPQDARATAEVQGGRDTPGRASARRARAPRNKMEPAPGAPPTAAPRPCPGRPSPASGSRSSRAASGRVAWPASRRSSARRTQRAAPRPRARSRPATGPAAGRAASQAPARPGLAAPRARARAAAGRAAGRRVPPAAAALAAGTAPGGDGHFIRAKVESV